MTPLRESRIFVTNDEFEWDDEKATSNLRKHGLSFEAARLVFLDAFALLDLDESQDHSEERFILTGMANEQIFVVVYTERGDRNRIISARKADRREQDEYYRNQTPA